MTDQEWQQLPTQIESKLFHLKSLVEKNSWDSDARESMIKEAIKSQKKPLIREYFEAYLNQFPTQVRIWVDWIQYEKDQGDYDQIELIFQKSIKIVPSVELYRHYLEYIIHINTEQEDGKETIIKTFDYILNVVGADKESGPLWLKYLEFVKEAPATSSYEEQQKMDHLRKIFHKAIQTPTRHIEEIWKMYDTFENGLNKITVFIID
jgi:cleavage stimulation factor subunit 3